MLKTSAASFWNWQSNAFSTPLSNYTAATFFGSLVATSFPRSHPHKQSKSPSSPKRSNTSTSLVELKFPSTTFC